MSDLLLDAQGLGKSYPTDSNPASRLRAWLRLLAGKDVPRSPVLQQIALQVKRGESLGIIGENGQVIDAAETSFPGVLRRPHGTLQRKGTLGALLELGAGFDQGGADART